MKVRLFDVAVASIVVAEYVSQGTVHTVRVRKPGDPDENFFIVCARSHIKSSMILGGYVRGGLLAWLSLVVGVVAAGVVGVVAAGAGGGAAWPK